MSELKLLELFTKEEVEVIQALVKVCMTEGLINEPLDILKPPWKRGFRIEYRDERDWVPWGQKCNVCNAPVKSDVFLWLPLHSLDYDPEPILFLCEEHAQCAEDLDLVLSFPKQYGELFSQLLKYLFP